MDNKASKQQWEKPALREFGTVEALTLQFKNKNFGGADDVLVAGVPILHNVS